MTKLYFLLLLLFLTSCCFLGANQNIKYVTLVYKTQNFFGYTYMTASGNDYDSKEYKILFIHCNNASKVPNIEVLLDGEFFDLKSINKESFLKLPGVMIKNIISQT